MADTIISKNDREDCLEFLEWVRENAKFEDFQKETFANGFMNLTNTLNFGSGGNHAKNESSNCNIQNVNGRLTPKVGFVYYIGDYTAPKVFNGLYYECLLTDQRIASHEEIKVDTGVKITDWEHDIYNPERFGLRN